jgi:hypothetical protein
MRWATRPPSFQSSRPARRVQRRIARWLGIYGRLIIVILITGTAASLGYFLRPQVYPIPDSAPVHPYLDVMASRPGVTVTASRAVLAYDTVDVDLTASTVSGSSNFTLYVEVSGVQVSWYDGEPQIGPTHWSVASDGSNEYSIGHSYALKPKYSYVIPFVVSYEGCDCVLVSGPYVAVSALSLDPFLLGPQQQVSSGGVTLIPLPDSGPFPGRTPGKYYVTSLSSIADDVVDLDSWNIPTSVTVVKAYPQVPANPYSNTWQWSNVTTGSLTLVNLTKQNTLNGNWFYAGIFLGIAGAGVLALVPEVSGMLTAHRKDKRGSARRSRPRKGPRQRRPTTPPVRTRRPP